jgi:phenylacetate-CoA ligase
MNNKQTDKAGLRSWFTRNVLMSLGDRLFGHPMIQRLSFLEKAQWWDRQRIFDARDKSLSDLINISYHQVPFYRQLMDNEHLKPADIRQAADLRKLPIATKDMFRKGYPALTTRKTGQKTYESRTSGSTGKNFCVMEDNYTAAMYRAAMMLVFEWAGWKFGEKHMQTGMNVSRGLQRRLKDTLLQCYYISVMDATDEALDRALATIEKHKIRHLWGYPGSVYLLARRAQEQKWNLPMVSVITWGDNLLQHYRQTLERAFGATVVDTYGCSEGIQISAQCALGRHYHIHSLDVIVEYVDDEGHPVDDDISGNIIVTRLNPGPMPLIRYKIGDMGIRGRQTTCDCGRGFELMESLQGRDTDAIVTPSGNRLFVTFFAGLLEYFDSIDCYQVVQDRTDTIKIDVVPRDNFTKDVANEIVGLLQKKGADLKIEINTVKDIPLTPAGKRKFIINKLDQKF